MACDATDPTVTRHNTRVGASGLRIARVDPWQLRFVPQAFDPSANPAPKCLMIVFLHGLGDNVMLGPAVRTLAKSLPATRISLLVRGDIPVAELWHGESAIAEVRSYRGVVPNYWDPVRSLRRRRELRDEIQRHAVAIGADRIAHVTGLPLPTQLTRPLRMPHTHRLIAAQLGVAPESYAYTIAVEAEHRAAVAPLFSSGAGAGPTVALNRTASFGRKFWSLRSYERLAAALRDRGVRVLHCYGPGMRAVERAFDGRNAERMPSDASTEDLVDQRLLVTAAAIERCRAVVSVDSALMHIALALRKPTVGIFTWPLLMNGHAYDARLAILPGQPDAQTALYALNAHDTFVAQLQ